MSKTTWGAIEKGSRVELSGRALEVVKAKRRGKKVDVKVRDRFGSFEATVKAKDPVKLAKAEKTGKAKTSRDHPLHDRGGAQTRWASKKEAASIDRREGLPAGNPDQRKPPHEPTAGPWDKPKGKTERMLEDILGAKLVGESDDESAGYYVPPVDVSTVAAHLLLFHGIAGTDYPSMVEALRLHDEEHTEAARKKGIPLKVNHWHTERRP